MNRAVMSRAAKRGAVAAYIIFAIGGALGGACGIYGYSTALAYAQQQPQAEVPMQPAPNLQIWEVRQETFGTWDDLRIVRVYKFQRKTGPAFCKASLMHEHSVTYLGEVPCD